jgi:hypothetical protein
VAVAAALLLGLAVPGYADRNEASIPADRVGEDRPVVPVDPAARAERASRIDRARQAVLDETYQAELPRYRDPAGSAGAGGGSAGDGLGGGQLRPRRQAGGELGESERDRRMMVDARDHEEGGAASSLMRLLLWGMVIVIGVLVASWIASELSRYGGDAELAPADEAADRMQAAAKAIIDRPLGDADELARHGLFAEAIHTLLLRTLQELVRSAAVRVAPATTSREILARVPLLADARSALAGLITAVEITHFGDAPASAADYERCRQQFAVFAQAFRGGGQLRPQAMAA